MFNEMLSYFLDPANWAGSSSIPARVGEHLWYSLLAVALAAVIAFPLGLVIGHTGKGTTFIVATANVLRALPSLGLMTLLVLLMGLGLFPPVIALVVLAVPPLLAGVYSGVANVSRATVDAARAMGMTEWQIVWQVELPNAMPLIVAGLRSAVLQVIATATIAAYVNLGGLGRYIFDGLAVTDYGRVLVGAVLVTGLALVVDGLLALLGRLVVPGRTKRGSKGAGAEAGAGSRAGASSGATAASTSAATASA
ncbi:MULTISPECIES: ABC transporter permease [unclassified Pseudoclavibacter]|uniref:ABC transporter permease n=1 Tax=unclassified Pseudoclavibacter TaxID=2615177 RepID=UPI000CE8128D|nr:MULTISPECIES: ABC transporter permease [unclassified Pseudoclavibacter]MBF4550524.1 ABC transporter permease [Pseudoclavibacter sp. VKM Ac-2888]PPG05639.1 ABC transporter permease [Pseudoclavibacter sp. RFBI5]